MKTLHVSHGGKVDSGTFGADHDPVGGRTVADKAGWNLGSVGALIGQQPHCLFIVLVTNLKMTSKVSLL